MARRRGSTSTAKRPAAQVTTETDTEITRCICGHQEFVSTAKTEAMGASPGLYVQCERCNVWQHGFCMGFMTEEEVPDVYYCEMCEPTFHKITNRNGVLMSKYQPIPHTNGNASHRSGPDPAKPGAQRDAKDREQSQSESKDRIRAQNGNSARHSTDLETPHMNGTGSGGSGSKRSRGSPLSPKQGSPALDVSGVKTEENINSPEGFSDRNSAAAAAAAAAAHERKKTKRPSISETDLASGRNRKRRSREDEILQRVLEESAREAREAEARRRSSDGLPLDDQQNQIQNQHQNQHQQPEGQPSDDESQRAVNENQIGDESLIEKPARSRRARNVSTPSSQTKRKEARNGSANGSTNGSANGSAPPRTSRVGRPARGGRRGGANGGSRTAEPGSPASSRRTANGVKKCKPRIPSQKTTLDEMRKRITSMLEYSSRIQDELAEERDNGIGLLRKSASTNKFDTPIEHISQLCDRNFLSLENLTRKMLIWEEQFGIKESP